MAEIAVARQPKQDRPDIAPWFGADTPFFRGNLFNLNPYALMRQFSEEMDRAFNTPTSTTGVAWSPAIEVKQKDDKLVVTAELPGLKKDDVKVHIDGDTLVVEGERKQEREEKREGYYHSERSYGKFHRSILLPEGAKTEQANAQFNNGVLEVSVPFSAVKTASKEIPVQEGPKKAA